MEQTSLHKLLGKLPTDQSQNIEAILTSEKTKDIASTILLLIGAAGIIGMTLTMPNSLKLLAPFLHKRYKKPLRSNEQREKVLQSYYYLKRSGQIQIEETEHGIWAKLTEKGKKKFQKITSDIHAIQRPPLWPGTWWLVAADIPTKDFKIAADMFRVKLRELKFYPLQRTLWIHPFDPRKELEYISNHYDIGKFITVMEIKRIDKQDEAVLKKYFTEKGLLK